VNHGNVDKVMADAKKIAQEWSEDRAPLKKLMRKYRCCYSTIVRAIRAEISKEQWQRIRYRHEVKGGRKTRFKKGCISWNKGIHYNPGGRSVETRFKPGRIRGAAAQKYRAVGTITIRHDQLFRRQNKSKLTRKDGTRRKGKPRRWIKIKNTGPPQYCWIPYARYLWLKYKGLIPVDYFVVHKDGNQMNDNIDNFVLMNHSTALKLQRARDPETMIVMAKTKRHKSNRQINNHFSFFWQCKNCSADFRQKRRPQRCKKCGGGVFERIKRIKQAG